MITIIERQLRRVFFMLINHKVMINDVVYVPSHDTLPEKPFLILPSQQDITNSLHSLYYLIYFSHWHRKNGPISESMKWLCPDLIGMLSDERYDTIKAMVQPDTPSPDIQKQAEPDTAAHVTVGGQLFIPAHLIKCQVSNEVGQAIVALCDAYALDTRVESPTLSTYVMRVFELLSPELHDMIRDGRLHDVYDRLDRLHG